jgi:hypothetical protein
MDAAGLEQPICCSGNSEFFKNSAAKSAAVLKTIPAPLQKLWLSLSPTTRAEIIGKSSNFLKDFQK